MSISKPTSTKKSSGRPKMKLADRFRVVAWSHFVKLRSGKRKDTDVARWLEDNGISVPSGVWSRYMRGEVSPQRSISGGAANNTLVKRVNSLIEGSANLFHHPLWDLLDFSEFLYPVELRSLSLKLGVGLRPLLVRDQPILRKDERPNDFWYRGPLGDDFVNQINPGNPLLNSLDALAMSMVHARMSYCSQDLVALVNGHWVGCIIMKALPSNQLFTAQERMQSLLLWIEDSCHAQLKRAFRNITNRSQAEETAHSLLMNLAIDHQLRIEEHIKKFPKSSRLTFAKWSNVAQLSDLVPKKTCETCSHFAGWVDLRVEDNSSDEIRGTCSNPKRDRGIVDPFQACSLWKIPPRRSKSTPRTG